MRRPLDPRDIPDELRRRLGLLDAVVIGLGSMIGAGIFAALAPAAYAAGSGLLLGLAVAAVVAYCNAISSARLAARYPASGGTYVYGRMRLGDFWGYLAGWGFVVGKTASCAAMALTVGFYVWPAQAHAVAVAVVVALTAVNYAMSLHACSATKSTPRRDASSKAISAANPEVGEPSMPTTTGACGGRAGRGSSGITATGP